MPKNKFQVIEECIWALKELGYTMDDKVYRAMIVERALLETIGKSPVRPILLVKSCKLNGLGL